MNKPENFTKEKWEKSNIAIKRLLGYSEEEWDAIQNPKLMTQELFDQCISASVRINDYDIYMKLSRSFPDYFDTMFAKIESHFTKPDSELPDISQTVVEEGLKRLEHSLMELEAQTR